MSLTIPNIATYLKSLGKAYVYTGTATLNGLVPFGMTEGEIGVDEEFQFGDLKSEEWTGPMVHARMLEGSTVKVSVPIIMGENALYDKGAPYARGGGRSNGVAVPTTTLLIVPVTEVGAGLSCAAGTWTPTAPVHALWIWKAMVTPGKYSFKHGDAGKVVREFIFEPQYDNTKPEGQKGYTIGNPETQGITGLSI